MRASSAWLLVVVALAGAGTLIVELSAVRLLAPWFGTSAGVWTNVIGVILLALALGYLVGARLSRGPGPRRRLGACLVLAALATAWLPAAAGPVAGLFLPSGVRLDQAAGLLAWGSLAAAFLLFFPTAAILGCVGPLAVEALQRERGGHAGDAGGRVLAASTLGSLAGTFATTHVALPRLGLTATFLVTGAGLAALGALLAVRPGGDERREASGTRSSALGLAVVAGAGTLAALGFARLTGPARTDGATVLAARETAYQSVRVVEDPEAPVPRRLEVNEVLDSFQSVWQPAPGLLPKGYYYDHFALPYAWTAGAGERPWRVCVLGLGAGTAVRVLEGVVGGGLVATGVELDPGVVALARRWMDLAADAPDRRVLAGLDGRAALRQDEERYDQIVVDTFANQVEIPPHLSTVEFFGEVAERLEPGGWASVNVGGFDLEDPVVEAVAGSLAEGFGARALALRVPFARNVVLFARREAEPPEPGSAGFQCDVARAVGASSLPGTWRWFEPAEAGRVRLTDDRNPIELLQRRSIEEARRRLSSGWGT